jgi:hypothetical protein
MLKRIFLFLALAVNIAYAQVDTGVIAGTVQDQAGAVLTGAKVTFKDEATGVSVDEIAGPQGDFSSPPLKPDTYVVAAGFKSQMRTGIRVQVQDRLNFDFKMTVATWPSVWWLQMNPPRSIPRRRASGR